MTHMWIHDPGGRHNKNKCKCCGKKAVVLSARPGEKWTPYCGRCMPNG